MKSQYHVITCASTGIHTYVFNRLSSVKHFQKEMKIRNKKYVDSIGTENELPCSDEEICGIIKGTEITIK